MSCALPSRIISCHVRLAPSLISNAIALLVLVRVKPPLKVISFPEGTVTVAVNGISAVKTISVASVASLIACCSSASVLALTVAACASNLNSGSIESETIKASKTVNNDFLLNILKTNLSPKTLM